MFVITGLHRGGAETQLALIARELMCRGWKPSVVSMTSGGPVQSELETQGIRVLTLDMRRGVPDPRGLIRLVRLLRSERPAILHTHMVHSNLLGRVASLFSRVPVVISTSHSITEGGRWRELAYRITDPLTDLTTIVSDAAAARYVRIGAVPVRKLKTVPNGVQLEAFRSNPESRASSRADLGVDEQFVWLAVGRFDTPKDYPNLLTAMSRLKNQNHILLIAGNGPLRDSMERLAAQLSVSEQVRFLGIRKDVPQLMTAADAYVMSSAWEGLPMVLLEAGASALPIVTTAVGGNNEIVHQGVNGFLAPAKNSGALADAMRRMEQLSAESRLSMGLAGRNHVIKHYSLSAVVDQWEEIYESLLQRNCKQIPYAPSISRA
jgi:glycosyltransferase involved in cell wall biosynthesis